MDTCEALDHLRDIASDSSNHPRDEAARVVLELIEDGPGHELAGELSAQLDEATAELEQWKARARELERTAAALWSGRDALSVVLRGMARRATLFRAVVAHALAENERLRAEIADYARRVTTGGPTKPIDTTWANADLPAPASADDPSAPPLRTGRGSDRMGPAT